MGGPGSGNSFPSDWRELVSGVDPTASHTLEMRLEYLDGPDNDVIQIYLDGKLIGSSTTFENFRDLAAPVFTGATHLDNAEAMTLLAGDVRKQAFHAPRRARAAG